jgi:hypothetical protein
MHVRIPQSKLDELTEQLATIEHERWSHWQAYMHGKCEPRADGSLVIPANLVAQWERQTAMSYGALSEAEKESDREQVRRYLPMVLRELGVIVVA